MQNTTYATRVTPGATVYGSDNHKVGTVADVGSSHFIIEKGFIFTTDIYVPMSAVATIGDDDNVYLSMTKDQIEHQDWSTAPSGDDTWRGSEAHAGTSGYAATDTVEEVEVGRTPRTETPRVTDTVRREEFDIDDDSDRPSR